MRILLLAMPDTVDVIDYFARFPNMAIISLAGNLPGHEVKTLDLVALKPNIREPLKKVMADFQPQLVGLSAMTFQFDTLLKVARFLRELNPAVRLAAGGYHASLMTEELTVEGNALPLDFLIRGEGEVTFRELVTELEKPDGDLSQTAGLSFRHGANWVHNPPRQLLDLEDLPLPDRETRLSRSFFCFEMPVDVAETSRGCPYNCKFCSITRMYGHTFRRFPVARIIADLQAIKAQGSKGVFFVDDNITYDIEHFRQVCQAIVQHGLNDLYYISQVTAVGIAKNPELVADMDRANFRLIFVGFEAMSQDSLKDVKKPTSPEINRRAASLLRRHHMAIIAGCIVGYPDDTRESVVENFRQIKKLLPDLIYAQYLTPYPKTLLREELLEAGLVVNADDFHTYDGFTCNVRTRHLSREQLYRCLKWEGVKSNFDPSLIAVNYFLRNHLGFFVKSIAKSVLTNLRHVLTARQTATRVDL